MASHGHSRSTFKTYLGDPLGVLVIDRLSLSPVQFGLIALGTALVVDAISFALVGDQVIALSGWTETGLMPSIRTSSFQPSSAPTFGLSIPLPCVVLR
jgi:Zn-dependent protease